MILAANSLPVSFSMQRLTVELIPLKHLKIFVLLFTFEI
jgi:hypothetical protein